jgi:hypothetical protein
MKQWIAAAIVAIVLVVAMVYVVQGGGVFDPPGNWPGESYKAEVRVLISRGWVGGPTIKIKEVNTYYGLGLSFGPLILAVDYDLEVVAIRNGRIIDKKTVGVTVDWHSSKTVLVRYLNLGPSRDAIIEARLYYKGNLEATDRVTI